MKDKIFDIAFENDGRQYKGWVNPSDKMNDEGQPVSFHVVLQDESFGYLSLHDCKWTVNEQRPAELVEAIGREIEKKYKL
jgi:hypothetical protein